MKISRKARKLLSVVLTVVLAIGTFQFAPGVRTIAKAADAPEAGQSYTLNFAKAFSEKTQLNGYTSEDGVFKVISEMIRHTGMMDSMEQHFITEIRLKLRLLEVQIFH